MNQLFSNYIKALFFSVRFFACIAGIVVLFIMAFFFPWLSIVPRLALGTFAALLFIDYWLLFGKRNGFFARRTTPERLSNGDDNELSIYLENRYRFAVHTGVIDEIPFQFQQRNIWFNTVLPAGQNKNMHYRLRPVKRGVYAFGKINVFVKSPLGLIMRRYRFNDEANVAVYPSFLQMRKYQLLAVNNRLSELGIKKIRKIGHSMEFEQIKDYVAGDDYRTVNWKATARRGQLMVNHFTDERSQQIYCVINKGRMMKMPFEKLTLLDYAINASLVLSNIALLKQDKAGLITFAEKIGTFLPADKRATQMNSILEVLHNQKTKYLESDFEKLYALIRTNITQRSLVVLFTNFESMNSLERELPYLRKIARYHVLLVVFFENTEIKELIEENAKTVEDVYVKTIAEKFTQEKKQIVKELHKYGIMSILTAPKNVTAQTLNKYLELKARQII